MANNQSFFKPQIKQTTADTTPVFVNINGRADLAVAILIIDDVLNPAAIHQKNSRLPEVLLKPLLEKLQKHDVLEKPKLNYLTPIKYLQQLCLETDPNHLVPALAELLNQLTLDHLCQHSRAYTSAFLDTTPHTISLKNLNTNARCLNPWLPSIITQLLEAPYYIYETSTHKTLQKTSSHSGQASMSEKGIQLHWHGQQCFVSSRIHLQSFLEKLDQPYIQTQATLTLSSKLSNPITTCIQHVTEEASRSADVFQTTKTQLKNYFQTEKTSTSTMINIYFTYLNQAKHIECPSTYFDTMHGTQALFQHTSPTSCTAPSLSHKTPNHALRETLTEALARLLTLGEPLNMGVDLAEKTEPVYTAPAA